MVELKLRSRGSLALQSLGLLLIRTCTSESILKVIKGRKLKGLEERFVITSFRMNNIRYIVTYFEPLGSETCIDLFQYIVQVPFQITLVGFRLTLDCYALSFCGFTRGD